MSETKSFPERLRALLRRPPREIAMFFVTSLAARGLGIVCQLLQVPIAIKALGSEAFGLWMAVAGLAQFIVFADFGMGIGLQNRLAESFAQDRRDEARELFASAFLFLCTVALALIGVLMLAADYVHAAQLFRLTEPETIAEAPLALRSFLVLFCLGLPIGLAQRLAFGRQKGWMHNTTQGVGAVLSLGGVALAAALGGGLVPMLLCAQGALVAGNALLLLIQLVQLRWLSLRGLTLRPKMVGELLRLGAFFSLQQIVNTILFALPQLVVSMALGAAAVTPYNLVQRLFNLFAVIQNSFMLPLWPAYSKARARGEIDWMRRTLRRSLLATACLSCAPMALGAIFAGPIIHLWVGGAAEPPAAALVWLLFGWNALVFFQQPFGYLLAGVSEVHRTTLYAVLTAVASAGLMLLLVHPLGLPGVVLGLMLGYLPFNFIGNVVETFRYLRAAAAAAPPSAPALSLASSPLL